MKQSDISYLKPAEHSDPLKSSPGSHSYSWLVTL